MVLSLPLMLPLVSGSLLHRHAVLGGPKGHRCALTRMEESEDARPLMEPARNVISAPTGSHSVHQSAIVAGLGVLSGALLRSLEPSTLALQHTEPLLHRCRHRAAVLLR
jgi:hypothetical protein